MPKRGDFEKGPGSDSLQRGTFISLKNTAIRCVIQNQLLRNLKSVVVKCSKALVFLMHSTFALRHLRLHRIEL